MRQTVTAGLCLFALGVSAMAPASAAKHRSNCADASEVTALQTAAVQQELMDAALGCGEEALHNFNAFQTAFSLELRRSDKTLLTMFKRIQGPSRGDAAYNLFKTNMASKAEIRRVHQITDFCDGARLVFQAALAPNKPTLAEFVAGVPVQDANDVPVGQCAISVPLTLQGAMAGPSIVPKPNPLRLAEVPPPPPPLPVVQQPVAQPVAEAKPAEKPKEEDKGFLSGIFGN